MANLLDNAIRHSSAGMQVTTTARRRPGPERAESTDPGTLDTVEVAVTDQGIGIAPEEQDRIFERFYRVDRARSGPDAGTGLGLAIVKHVVANHGGRVSVFSRPRSGSTFTITLPAMPVPAEPSTSAATASEASA